MNIKEKMGWTEQDLKDFEMLADYLEKHPTTEKDLKEWEEKQDNMTLGEIADFLLDDMKFMGEKINLPEPDDKIYVEEI